MPDNVLLVVFDALRVDRVGCFGSSSLTPNIDAVAADGEAFERCFACSNVTDSCLTTIMTGQYPSRHGIVTHGPRITEENLERVAATVPLAERLQPTHVTLGANRKHNWHERGFDRYVNPNQRGRSRSMEVLSQVVDAFPDPVSQRVRSTYDWLVTWYLQRRGESVRTDERVMMRELERFYPSADKTTDTAVDLLSDVDEPWFLNAHYWDAHLPYNPTVSAPSFVEDRTYEDGDVPLREVLGSIEGSPWAEELERAIGHCDTLGDVKRLYDAGAWYADREFGRLVEFLKDRGEYEDTAIVLTADHGESLTEHGILFDHHGLYDVTTHVPLVVKAPGFDGRESAFVQHFDIVPTVLDLAGVGYDSEDFDGQSLAPHEDGGRELDRSAAYMESGYAARKRSVRTPAWRYTERVGGPDVCRFCEISHGPGRELYDIERDPDETENLVEDVDAKATELADQIDAWYATLPEGDAEAVDFEVPEEHLRELGYL